MSKKQTDGINDLVYKVMTIKSGKFAFSRKFDRQAVMPLLVEFQVMFRTINDLPILPNALSAIEGELIRRCIFGTAAIEGNPLDEDSVGNLLQDVDVEKIKFRAEREIVNLKNAYQLVDKAMAPKGQGFLSEGFIKKAQKFITTGIDYEFNEPGQYRNHKVMVGNEAHGGTYTPPKILEDVKTLMAEFVSWFNSAGVKSEDPAIQAALAHYHLALIHPFANGNGRSARLIEAMLLTSAGIRFAPKMLSNFYYRNLDRYFRAFTLCEKNRSKDITPFISFYLKGLILSLAEIKDKITVQIRILVLKDYFRTLFEKKQLSARQYDLLKILMMKKDVVEVSDLYVKMPHVLVYRNVDRADARADLDSLEQAGILVRKDAGLTLNLRMWG